MPANRAKPKLRPARNGTPAIGGVCWNIGAFGRARDVGSAYLRIITGGSGTSFNPEAGS
jgi:hypothetical protein